MNRRLYRCRENRILAGVASGVAEFFDLDPTLVRVLWFLSIFVGGLGSCCTSAWRSSCPSSPPRARRDTWATRPARWTRKAASIIRPPSCPRGTVTGVAGAGA